VRVLSPVEQAYLSGTRDFTKPQQRYIKCRLKKKLRLLNEESCNAAARLERLEGDSLARIPPPTISDNENEENNNSRMGRKGFEPLTPAMSRLLKERG
jgi:hypothetical protein